MPLQTDKNIIVLPVIRNYNFLFFGVALQKEICYNISNQTKGKNKMRVIEIQIGFSGIYEWGVGFVSESARQNWENFWENLSSSFWSNNTDYMGSHYLISIGGGGMIHPMDGCHFFIRTIGHCYTHKNGEEIEVFDEVDDLIELFDLCAKACGGESFVIKNCIHEF